MMGVNESVITSLSVGDISIGSNGAYRELCQSALGGGGGIV